MRQTPRRAIRRQCVSRNGYVTSFLLGSLATGSGCAHEPASDPAAPTTPSVNVGAHQQVTISGVMPNTFAVCLFATYESTTPDTKNPCGRWLRGAGDSVPLGVTIPLDVAQRGGSYEATALVDKFEPGKCGWHFYGISFTVNGVGSGDFVAQFVDRVPEGDKHVKRWCGNNVSRFRQGVACLAPRWALNPPTPSVDPRLAVLARLIPEDQRGSTGDALVPLTTTSFLIDFYDIDALVKDAPTQCRSRCSRRLPQTSSPKRPER